MQLCYGRGVQNNFVSRETGRVIMKLFSQEQGMTKNELLLYEGGSIDSTPHYSDALPK